MKKVLIALLIIVLVIGGGIWYLLSGADDFIKRQIEGHGSTYLETEVSVAGVELALREGRLSIDELEVENPEGFSDEDAFSFDQVILDLGAAVKEPYVVQNIRIDAPEVLYEVNASGEGNLMVLKDNLQSHLSSGNASQSEKSNDPMPLLIVENVTVTNTRLRIDFEQLDTGELKLDKKAYDVTLPTFNAGPVGNPNGMPADQVGAAIVDGMLNNLIAEAKAQAKKVLEEKAKEKAKEKIDEEKDKLMDKASEKLKGLLDKN
ncbi:hypothetical protein CA267_008030 [Alteromonas pelagimontana]|uniref:AsmA family protein n=1 Tax=Alteromonas pelagimontana TaxID=1858656 RepID=A0A6M4MDM4_9ALTE|nr:hypothetical protein [Alteromonas pelagimontana]QJR80730.1 hypothetical protein CA267_008030 [Alteromonas pelagimontana]